MRSVSMHYAFIFFYDWNDINERSIKCWTVYM